MDDILEHNGKTIERIVKHESSVEIYFTDGTMVEFWSSGEGEHWLSYSQSDMN